MPYLPVSRFARRRHLLARAALATALAGTALAWSPLVTTAGASAAATPVTTGSLVWGFKQSFRAYTGAESGTPGALTVAGGATAGKQGVVTFPVAAGAFNAATSTTDITFRGSMQFRAHCEAGLGLPAGQCALDMTFSDFHVTISATQQVLRAHLVGRRNTAGYPFVDDGVITIANLDIAPATVNVKAGVTSWSGIAASLAAAAATPTTYNAATPLDPVQFSYTGPGARPAVGEQWTPPGSRTIAAASRWQGSVAQNQPAAVYVDDRNHVVHVVQSPTSFDPSAPAVIALGQPDLKQRGTGSSALAADHANQPTAFDPESATVFLSGSAGIIAETWTGNQYHQQTLSPNSSAQALTWDVAQQSLQALVVDDTGQAALLTLTRSAGSWTSSTHSLPVPAEMDPTSYYVPGSANAFAALSDGDLLLTRSYTIDGAGAVDNNPDPLLLHPQGAGVDVRTVAITTHPHGDTAAGPDASSVTTGPQGQAAFYSSGNTGYAPSIRLASFAPNSTEIAAVQPIPLEAEEPLAVAFDPSDGTVWAKGVTSGTLIGLLAGQPVSRLVDADAARAYTLQIGADHTIITAGRTADSHANVTSYTRLGISPTVTTNPVNAAARDGSEVTLVATATGSPAPTLQWQQRLPGTTTFVDLPAATTDHLNLRASAATGGAAYRAIFHNAAGSIASDIATLQVLTEPAVRVQPTDRTVAAGAMTTFQVMTSGNPEPTVSWQQRHGGAGWTDVVANPQLVLGPGTLSVARVRPQQTGLQIRAKVTNSVGTVYSRAATLTVKATTATTPTNGTFGNVSLVWSGNEVLQKPSPAGPSNYFSAGVSDGSQQSYHGSVGNVTVKQQVQGSTRNADWNNRNAFDTGGQQWVQLNNGSATVRPDGSATVSWTGSWSVNFYGGLAPFTFTNPVLTIDHSGSGTLKADLSGYSSSQADPTHKTKLEPVRAVTVSTVRNVHLNTSGATVLRPGYAGVRVSNVPAGAQPQNTKLIGWGAWPQSFTNFQFKTGLSSYWYTSGGAADADKPGLPFTVDFSSASPTPASTAGAHSGGSGGNSEPLPPITPAANPPADATGGRLASTGAELELPLLTGTLLLLLGTSLILLGRQRRRALCVRNNGCS